MFHRLFNRPFICLMNQAVAFHGLGARGGGVPGWLGRGAGAAAFSVQATAPSRLPHSPPPSLPGFLPPDGVDTAGIALDALRRQVAIIPQDPVLFSGGGGCTVTAMPVNLFSCCWSARVHFDGLSAPVSLAVRQGGCGPHLAPRLDPHPRPYLPPQFTPTTNLCFSFLLTSFPSHSQAPCAPTWTLGEHSRTPGCGRQ